MGIIAAVAFCIAGLVGLVLYLYKRHDSPAAAHARTEEEKRRDYDDLDKALGESDADTLTRMFSELDDRAGPHRVRGQNGDSAFGPGDKAAP